MSDHRLACTYTKLPQYLGNKIGPWENISNYFLITKLFLYSIAIYCLGRNKNEWHVGKYKIRKISRDVGCSK